MAEEKEKVTNVIQKVAQPFKLQLIRGQRGGYGWKIEVQAETRDELLYHADMIDTYLRGKYLEGHARAALSSSPTDPHTRMEKTMERAKEAKNIFGGE